MGFKVTQLMPLWMRLVALVLIIGLLSVTAYSSLRIGNGFEKNMALFDNVLETKLSIVHAQIALDKQFADHGLDTAKLFLSFNEQSSLNAVQKGLAASKGRLTSLWLSSSNGDIIASAGSKPDPLGEDVEKLVALYGENKSYLSLKSKRAGPSFAYVVLPIDAKYRLIGKLDDWTGPLKEGFGDVSLVGTNGHVLMSTEASLKAMTTQEAFNIDLNVLRKNAAKDKVAEGAVEESGFIALKGRLHEDGKIITLVHTQQAKAQSLNDFSDIILILVSLIISFGLGTLLWLHSNYVKKKMQTTIQAGELYRQAVESAQCGIWEVDLLSETLKMSQATASMLGRPGQKTCALEDFFQAISHEQQSEIRNAFFSARNTGVIDVSFRVLTPHSNAVWLDLRGQSHNEREDSGFMTLSGVVLDVSEERMAQMRAQRAEARLNDAINSISEAFVLWDRHQRLRIWNKPFADLFGIDERFLRIGTPRNLIEKVMHISISHHANIYEKGVEQAQEVLLHDGRWLLMNQGVTRDGGLVLTATDITAMKLQDEVRKKNEENLSQLVDKLDASRIQLKDLAKKYEREKIRAEGANHAKSEFLANMSHELRTPLNAINGFSEIMAQEMFGPLGNARYKEYAKDILNSGQHLLSLINDILDMSKIEAGKMTMNFEPIEINDLVNESLRLVKQRAENHHLTLAVDIPPLLEIEVDYRAFKQILLNLLTNAIKFTPEGGTISVLGLVSDDAFHLTVKDTGIGISQIDLERLARPFEQIENQFTKTREGTGLGLALTRSLVELHHGRLEITSEVGLGTSVHIILPREQGQKMDLTYAA